MSRALIVVDVQVDFCEDGSMAVPGGQEVARSVTRYIQEQGSAYSALLATRDAHVDPGDHFSDSPDFVDSWPPHCRVGTIGAEFTPALGFRDFNAVFDKGEYSAAYSGFEGHSASGLDLIDWLRQHDIDAVDVCGIATDYCVKATALDAARAGLGTTVLVELTAAVAPDGLDDVLSEFADAGITVRN